MAKISYRRFLSCMIFFIICIAVFQFSYMHQASKKIRSYANTITRSENKDNPDDRMHFITGDDKKKEDPIQKLLKLLKMDLTTAVTLPSHDDFVNLYGNEIVIEGLDRCKAFRDSIPESHRQVGPAGIFNTGTNLMSVLMNTNCRIPHNMFKTMKWQVPWGKHTPARFRYKNVASIQGKGVNQTEVMPVVMIKDPYTWMSSMCRHSYVTNWRHRPEHCPNLIPNEIEKSAFIHLQADRPIPVSIRYSDERIDKHTSLAHVWNDWYNEYDIDAQFPRLIVRFEDLLIYPQEVITTICDCVGGEIRNPKKFSLVSGTAKYNSGPHTGSNSLIPSLKRYGDAQVRKNDLPDRKDIDYAKKVLDRNLMEKFHYSYIP